MHVPHAQGPDETRCFGIVLTTVFALKVTAFVTLILSHAFTSFESLLIDVMAFIFVFANAQAASLARS